MSNSKLISPFLYLLVGQLHSLSFIVSSIPFHSVLFCNPDLIAAHASYTSEVDACFDEMIQRINETRERVKHMDRLQHRTEVTAGLLAAATAAQSSLADVSASAAFASDQANLTLLQHEPPASDWVHAMREAALMIRTMEDASYEADMQHPLWQPDRELMQATIMQLCEQMEVAATTIGPATADADEVAGVHVVAVVPAVADAVEAAHGAAKGAVYVDAPAPVDAPNPPQVEAKVPAPPAARDNPPASAEDAPAPQRNAAPEPAQ